LHKRKPLTENRRGDSESHLAVLKNRNFALMWVSQISAQFAAGLIQVAGSLLVYSVTGSAMSVAVMLVATSLPGMLFGLVAGVYADVLDRRRIMVVTAIGTAISAALIPQLLPRGVWTLYLLMAASSSLAQFYAPAYSSSLPDVVGDRQLAAANSLNASSEATARGLGYAAAGVIAGAGYGEWSFYLAAICSLVTALLIGLVRIPALKAHPHSSIGAVFGHLREGADYLFESPILRSLFWIMAPAYVLFGFDSAITLPFLDRALGATASQYGLIEGISLVGLLVGGLLMAVLGDRLREGQWLVVGFVGIALVNVVYSQTQFVWVALMTGFAYYMFNVPVYIAQSLVRQRNTTRDVRGRVTGFFYVSRDLLLVVGIGLVGLADYFDVRTLVFVDSLFFLTLGIIALFLPGLGRPAAEWKNALRMLRGVADAPGIGTGRTATLTDIEHLQRHLPTLCALTLAERKRLAPLLLRVDTDAGAAVVRQGEKSDAAYFVLEGRAIAGLVEDGYERVLEVMNPGDFFGEIAALTGSRRTANVVTDLPSALLKVPASELKRMLDHPELWNEVMGRMNERMTRAGVIDLSGRIAWDPALLQELRKVPDQPPPAEVDVDWGLDDEPG
jgi:MFS family permease